MSGKLSLNESHLLMSREYSGICHPKVNFLNRKLNLTKIILLGGDFLISFDQNTKITFTGLFCLPAFF